jgi:very-short-patch-repair endonuclease
VIIYTEKRKKNKGWKKWNREFWAKQYANARKRGNQTRNKLSEYAKELQARPTPGELRFEEILKEIDVPYLKQPFCYQRRGFIPDFAFTAPYCAIIEIDGVYHLKGSQPQRDRSRDRFFALKGYATKRFQNKEVFNTPNEVKQQTIDFLAKQKQLNEGCYDTLFFYHGVRSFNLSPGNVPKTRAS